MKKTSLALFLIGALAVMMVPKAILAQEEPATCCELGRDLRWAGFIGSKDCTAGAHEYCLFKAWNAVGEVIGAGQCGAAAEITTRCQDNAVWNDMGTYYEQQASCLADEWGLICLLNGVNIATNWFFTILIIIVSLMISFGAFTLVTAGGDSSKVTLGKNYILYALIGLVIAFLSRAFPATLKALLRV